MSKVNIAIFTPNRNPYSETFIQAHKNLLKGNVFFYYGKKNNIKLENSKLLKSKWVKFKLRFVRKLTRAKFSQLKENEILASLKENKIEVILVEYGTHAHHLLSILKQSKLSVVVHFHGYDASVHKVINSTNNFTEVFKIATYVIAVSQEMKAQLLRLGCNSEKLKYNVYGPRKEFETIRPKFTKKQFVSVGRFTNKKAPYYIILAFNEVLKFHPDAQLIMAGDGELLNTTKNLASHFGIAENISFPGIIDSETYLSYLSESYAMVQHSITAESGDMEGTPLSILEASIAGVPVISTFHAGIPDVIKHNITGLLSNEHDVLQMSEHMIKLLDNRDLVKELGNNGKLNIKNNFSIDRHIVVLNNILHQAIKA